MKKLLLGAVALTMLATACKKSDDDNGPSNSFTVNGTTYAVNTFTKLGSTVLIGNTGGSNATTITFSFGGSSSGAPAVGTYKVVDNADESGEVQFAVATTDGSSVGGYLSTGDGDVNVTVGDDGGKMTITMAAAPAEDMMGGSGTVNVSANAKEL